MRRKRRLKVTHVIYAFVSEAFNRDIEKTSMMLTAIVFSNDIGYHKIIDGTNISAWNDVVIGIIIGHLESSAIGYCSTSYIYKRKGCVIKTLRRTPKHMKKLFVRGYTNAWRVGSERKIE